VASGLLDPNFRTAPSTSGNTALGKQAQELQQAKEQAEKQQQAAQEDYSPYSDFTSTKPQPLANAEAERILSDAVAKRHPGTGSASIGRVLGGRDASADQLEHGGKELGISPQGALKRLGTGIQGMKPQVGQAVGQDGITWAQQNHPEAGQKASQAQ